jgi:uncharacterized protein (TIGR03067 family)
MKNPSVGAFKRIVKWLARHELAKAVLESLRKPASAAAIAEVEAKAKVKLPPALISLYRLHDGQDEDAANKALGETIESGLFPSIEGRGDLPFLLVPLKQLKSGLSSKMPGFRKGWIPFGDNYGGDNIVLDFASKDPKKRGRVLQFNHEYGCATELAPSFEQYLQHIADGLNAGKIIWDAESGLSYRRGRDWDDLIDKKKVEYEEDEPEPEPKTGAKVKVAKGVDAALVGKWTVTSFEPTDRSTMSISGYTGDAVEFTARGDFIVKPPPNTFRHANKYRFTCVTSKNPPWIDLFDRNYRDLRCQGVYRVDGADLLICTGQIREVRADRLDRPKKSWIIQRMTRVAKV